MLQNKETEPMSDQFVGPADKLAEKKSDFKKCLSRSIAAFLIGVIAACLVWLLMLDVFIKR